MLVHIDRIRMTALAPVVGLLVALAALALAPQVARADFGTDPTPGGLTITTYTGSLEEFEADGEAWNLVSAFATVEGEFVGFVFGAPDFVNAEFSSQFASKLDNEGLIVRAGNFEFEQEGNLVRDNPGMPPGVWFLLYDEPGAPGTTSELEFDEDTECLADGAPIDCESIEVGTRVSIQGSDTDPVRVLRLEVVNGD